MEVVCCNSYIIARGHTSSSRKHSTFRMKLPLELGERAVAIKRSTRILRPIENTMQPLIVVKTRRFSKNTLAILPLERFDDGDHTPVKVTIRPDRRQRCFLCRTNGLARKAPKV